MEEKQRKDAAYDEWFNKPTRAAKDLIKVTLRESFEAGWNAAKEDILPSPYDAYGDRIDVV